VQVGEGLGERLCDLGLRVSKRGDEEQPSVDGGPRQVAKEEEGGGVSPVPVVEDEEDRLAAADRRQELRHREVQAVPLGVRVGLERLGQLPDAGREVRDDSRELAAPGSDGGPQLCGIGFTREVVECLDEWAIRGADHGVAGPVERQGSIGGGLSRELAHETALPRSRLAAEQHHPGSLALGVRHRGSQRLELGHAADERERRDQTW
jgi:hypothetical protein